MFKKYGLATVFLVLWSALGLQTESAFGLTFYDDGSIVNNDGTVVQRSASERYFEALKVFRAGQPVKGFPKVKSSSFLGKRTVQKAPKGYFGQNMLEEGAPLFPLPNPASIDKNNPVSSIADNLGITPNQFTSILVTTASEDWLEEKNIPLSAVNTFEPNVQALTATPTGIGLKNTEVESSVARDDVSIQGLELVNQAKASLDRANETLKMVQEKAISEGTAEAYERVEAAVAAAKQAAGVLKAAEELLEEIPSVTDQQLDMVVGDIGSIAEDELRKSASEAVVSVAEEAANEAADNAIAEAAESAIEEVIEDAADEAVAGAVVDAVNEVVIPAAANEIDQATMEAVLEALPPDQAENEWDDLYFDGSNGDQNPFRQP